jgi:hypothetical protein
MPVPQAKFLKLPYMETGHGMHPFDSSRAVIVGDQMERPKPEPEIFFAAEERALSDCIVIGDDVWGLLLAVGGQRHGAARRSLGLIRILAGGGGHRVPKPEQLPKRLQEIGNRTE